MQIDSLFEDAVGAAVMVIDRGEVVFQKTYGVANMETQAPVTPATNFRLASVSKQFTAASALLLLDRGQLTLDDPLTRFFPGFHEYGQHITVRNLLQHRSGLPDYEDLIPAGTSLQLQDQNVLNLLMQTRAALFEPGSRFKYSNSGYVLLGLIVEVVSDQPFDRFVKMQIFEPPGMDGSLLPMPGRHEVERRALGHVRKDGAWVVGDQGVTTALRGDGTVYSSLNDLVRWINALDAKQLLSEEAYRLMYTAAPAPERNGGYGCGWVIDTYRDESRVYHNGETRGFRLGLHRFPERRAAVVVLQNYSRPEAMNTLCEKIAGLTLFAETQP